MRGTQIGLIDPSGETGRLIPIARLAQEAGVGVDEVRLHHHHLHADGFLAITRQGLLRLAMNTT